MAAVIVPPFLPENRKAAGNPFKPAAVTLNCYIRNTHFLNFILHPTSLEEENQTRGPFIMWRTTGFL